MTRRRLLRSRSGWILAVAAFVLNVCAPVIAYAAGCPDQAGVVPVHVTDGHPSHHHQHHAHASGDAASHAPVTPHCQFCLDFASGLPLAYASPALAAAPGISLALLVEEADAVHGRSSLRLALSRAPPRFLS